MFQHALLAFSILLQPSMSLFISFPVEGHLGFVLQFSAIMKKVSINFHIEVLRCEHKDLFHLGKYVRARLLCPVLNAYLQETARLFPIWAHGFTFPPAITTVPLFPHFHPHLVLSRVFLRRGLRISGLFSHSDRCIVVSCCGFNFYFPMD